MECWDYELHFGKPYSERLLVNASPVIPIPAKKILRRLHELQRGGMELGWNPEVDYQDLEEFTPKMGCVLLS
jgi:hypothetical protein